MIKYLKFKNELAARQWVNEIRSNYQNYQFSSTVDKYMFQDITQLIYDFPDRVMEVEIDHRGVGVSIDGWSIGKNFFEFLLYDYDIIDAMVECNKPAGAFFVELENLIEEFNMEHTGNLFDMFKQKDI